MTYCEKFTVNYKIAAFSIAASVEATSSSDISLSGAIAELKHARERLASYENLKKEAERAAEKMLALDDNVPQTVGFLAVFVDIWLKNNYR